MRLRRRDVTAGGEFFECPETKTHYLRDTKGTYKKYTLVKPVRFDELIVDTGQVDEDDEPILEVRLRPITFTYLEKLNPLSAIGADVEEDGEIDSDEEDDLFRYLFMGAQQWLVFAEDDPRHNFRKEVRFRMENSFAAESLRKKERALKRLENGLPDIDSAAYKDFKNKKNKKIMKDYGTDDFVHF